MRRGRLRTSPLPNGMKPDIGADTGIRFDEFLFFAERLLRIATSCEERRLAEYQTQSWWDFLDAGSPLHTDGYRHYLAEGSLPPPPKFDEAAATLLEHIAEMHAFYGEIAGVRIARKHIGWYLARLPEGDAQRRELNRLESAAEQYDTLAAFLHRQELAEWPTDYRNSAAV